jgi:hypothetical protein
VAPLRSVAPEAEDGRKQQQTEHDRPQPEHGVTTAGRTVQHGNAQPISGTARNAIDAIPAISR